MPWHDYQHNPSSRYEAEERGAQLAEQWMNGQHTFVVDQLHKLPKAQAVATAVHLTRYLSGHEVGDLTELLMRRL